MPLITLANVEQAAARIAGHVSRTPFLHSATLSHLTGAEIWLKFENLQFTASFKQRGALNRMLGLTEAERKRGVLAVSAGNHAQGVAYHASQLGIPATIVMPTSTPAIKANRTREFGAEVILAGSDFAEATAAIPALVSERGLTFIHPYDDDAVIAGQGTVGLEMLADQPDLDVLVVAIGGGGLISGIAVAARALAPRVEIVGVQSEAFPGMAHHFGHWPHPAQRGVSIAEGIAVIAPGQRTRDYVGRLVDRIEVVTEASIENGIALLLQIEKTLAEGAGAAGLAAVLSRPEQYRGRRVGLILCGGNIDNRLLSAILQRQLAREGRLIRLRTDLSDQAGALAMVCAEIGALSGNINSVSHDRAFGDTAARCARVEFEIEVPEPEAANRILARLAELGLSPARF
ncbi:MAG: threonine ammonia-lyase [Alphaproteobacteria bacterium]|nr:threonine ammonia-lyase [Alphaproteobacteria bacterium]